MLRQPYVGTVGFLVEADCGQDITGATNLFFRVRKPSGAEETWSATPCAIDGVANRGLQHPTTASDLNEPGEYRLHACLTLGDWTGPGEVGRLLVRELFS